jgi:hypothetical protein
MLDRDLAEMYGVDTKIIDERTSRVAVRGCRRRAVDGSGERARFAELPYEKEEFATSIGGGAERILGEHA